MFFFTVKTKRVFGALSNLPRALKMIWSVGGGWAAAQISLLVTRGLLPTFLIYLTKLFVDALLAAVGENRDLANTYRIIWLGAVFGVVTVLSEILGGVSQMIYTIHAEKLSNHIYNLIHEKSIRADMAFYEQPESFDHLHRAKNEAHYRPLELISQFGGILQNSVTLISMCVVLLRYGIWLPAVLLLSALPAFYAVVYSAARLHRWERGITSLRRRSFYYNDLLTTGETAAEIRLFELGNYFSRKFAETRAQILREQLRLALRQRYAELTASLTALGLTAAVFIWLVQRTLYGLGTLGDLALFYQVFNQGQILIRAFLSDIGRLLGNGLFLGDLFEYLDLEPGVVSPPNAVSPPVILRAGISFENVTFRYGNAKKNALKNFNLFVPANKTVAVVGENGAGKSTLIKLLCRFYDPERGSIKLDGVDLREISIEELRRMTAILFQSPIHYGATVGENIAYGKVAHLSNREKMENAARDAGAAEIIGKLPDGYDQMLGHLFAGGVELSGGEWQRMALARAFFRRSSLILLDEPTSAMDPWAEADWLKRFLNETRDKTVLIITHRFTTAMRADLIYVMGDGEIVESGTHDELLKAHGRYARSWQEQIKSFKFGE